MTNCFVILFDVAHKKNQLKHTIYSFKLHFKPNHCTEAKKNQSYSTEWKKIYSDFHMPDSLQLVGNKVFLFFIETEYNAMATEKKVAYTH